MYDYAESYRPSFLVLAAFGSLVASVILTLRRPSDP